MGSVNLVIRSRNIALAVVALAIAISLVASGAPRLEAASTPAAEAHAQIAPDAATYGPIASRALQDLHTWVGQCFPWVRLVVQAATGRTMGFGYRSGYLQAGAIEIAAADARDGDVIQLIDDSYTAPDADYVGMHTAIVLKNLGGGRYDAIDSNQQWDGIVRLRSNYDPFAAAARYSNINVHFYRFPGNAGSSAPAPPPDPVEAPATMLDQPLPSGSAAVVLTDSGCLRLRSAAGIDANVIDCLAPGTRVLVVDDVEERDGYRWQRVVAGTQIGFVADSYLQLDPSPATPPPAPAPAAPIALAAPLAPLTAIETPAAGGLTVGASRFDDPAALVTAQPYAVESVSVLDIVRQRFLIYIPGAPALVNSLNAGSLQPGTIVTIRRAGTRGPTQAPPSRPASLPAASGTPHRLAQPPVYGLTQGIAGTTDPAALAAAQLFPVQSVSVLHVPSQSWLVHIPGAPAAVNTLNTATLRADSAVTLLRGPGTVAPQAAPSAPTGAAPSATAAPAPPASAPARVLASLTYYYCEQGANPASIGDGGGFCGVTASGANVYEGAAACAREHRGQRFTIDGDPTGRTYTCADTGSAVRGEHRDIFFRNSDDGYAWWIAVGASAWITIDP